MSEDWIEKELERKRREQEYARRERRYLMEQRTTRLGYFATALGFALAFAAVVWVLYAASQNDAQREHEERIACNEAGGTFISLQPDNKLCLIGMEER